MTYTAAAVLCVVIMVVLDLWVVRTRILATARWWASYLIIVFFQLLTNGWLTGREIVQYDPGAILGEAEPVVFGQGRVVYAPVEDLMFGFGLVLATVMVWQWLKPSARSSSE